MAITKIIKVKTNVGGCIDYAQNKDKTENGIHVTYYGCGRNSAEYCFLTALSNNDCNKDQLVKDEVKAYHIIQSFANTDDISPEEANKIGQQMMEELFGGRYAFVCATHSDKDHIHNHIVVCASEMAMNGKKLNDDLALLHKIRKISDRLCKENGLDVIENPKGKGKSYKEWFEDKNNPNGSKKTQLRNMIDEKIRISRDFDDFIEKMKESGADISFGNSKKYGRVTKYRLLGSTNKDKWNRGYSLGSSYSDNAIIRRIHNRLHREEEREARKAQRAAMTKAEKAIKRTKLNITSMIDTSKDEITSKNIGLEMWKNRQNAMRAENIKKTLRDKFGIDYTQLISHINSLVADNNRLESEIQTDKKHMDELRHIISDCKIYADAYKTHCDYENAEDKEKYYQEHDQELNAFFAAEEHLTRANINFTGLTDDKYSDSYIKSLQATLEKAEKELSEKEDEIQQNKKDITELTGYQNEMGVFHGRKQGLD